MADAWSDRDESHAASAGVRPLAVVAVSRANRLLRVQNGDRPAILKTAAAATMADPIARRRFSREGRVGHCLRHPHLVQTLRYAEHWILLGDLGGVDEGSARLQQLIRDSGPRARADVEQHVGELGSALAYLHARGFVHRDVKPGNILVASNGRTVLIDLGAVGLAVDDELDRAEFIGSPAWMAPEQLLGCRAHPSADIWSLAMVTLFALAGRSAFVGSATAVLERRRKKADDIRVFAEEALDGASGPLRELIMSGLSTDPQSRPPASAFAQLGRHER